MVGFDILFGKRWMTWDIRVLETFFSLFLNQINLSSLILWIWVEVSKQTRDLTHPPNLFDLTWELAKLMSVMVNSRSPPLEPKNGKSIGKSELEKPIFNWPDCLHTGKLSFSNDNNGLLVFFLSNMSRSNLILKISSEISSRFGLILSRSS